MKTLVSMIIGDVNQMFLLNVGEDLSKDTAIDIMDEVNFPQILVQGNLNSQHILGQFQHLVFN